MKPKFIARDKSHLDMLINVEIKQNGNECDLNHIDVSRVIDMSGLSNQSSFNGNISKWNVSNVKSMSFMFALSKFNGDISKWDISKVTDVFRIFDSADFNQNISDWKPFSAKSVKFMFLYSNISEELIPYWSQYEDLITRRKFIELYHLNNELGSELILNNIQDRRIKV